MLLCIAWYKIHVLSFTHSIQEHVDKCRMRNRRTNRQTWLYFNLVYCYLHVLQLKCSKKLLYTFNSKQLLEGQLEILIVKQTGSFKRFLIKKKKKI